MARFGQTCFGVFANWAGLNVKPVEGNNKINTDKISDKN